MANPENTKLCDFTSTNNSDFICTPIAPAAPAANFYEIKPALLNLVMKEQFKDAAAYLNNFIEHVACDKVPVYIDTSWREERLCEILILHYYVCWE
jgi:hypothetical protein